MKRVLLTLVALLLASSAYGLDCQINCYNMVVTTPESEFDNSFSVGVGGSVSQSPYKKHDASWMIAPLVLHDSKYFYLKGTSGGFYLFRAYPNRRFSFFSLLNMMTEKANSIIAT